MIGPEHIVAAAILGALVGFCFAFWLMAKIDRAVRID